MEQQQVMQDSTTLKHLVVNDSMVREQATIRKLSGSKLRNISYRENGGDVAIFNRHHPTHPAEHKVFISRLVTWGNEHALFSELTPYWQRNPLASSFLRRRLDTLFTMSVIQQ
eukprot:1139201-Pelagomonas_calceolata.AAC.10